MFMAMSYVCRIHPSATVGKTENGCLMMRWSWLPEKDA